MAPSLPFIVASISVWLLVCLGKVSQGSPHGEPVSSLDLDIGPEEAITTWPDHGCMLTHNPYAPEPLPEQTWFVLLYALPNCSHASKEAKDYHPLCERKITWKEGCHSSRHAASVRVAPGNCTIRTFKDDHCLKLVDDFGPVDPPHWDWGKRKCVELADHRSETLKGSFNVTCPVD